MLDEDLKAELERLRKENEALKTGASSGIRMKVSEKRGGPVFRNRMAAWLRWILGWITPPISPRLLA
jgi:hypothetical protein